MPTALTAFLTTTNDTLLGNARQLTNVAPSSETSVTNTANVSSSAGYVLLQSRGGSPSYNAAEPSQIGRAHV